MGCSDHALMDFVILKNAGLAKSRAWTLCFRRANFLLLKELLSGIPWETVLKGVGKEQSWQLFKDTLLRVQRLSIPQQKSSRGGRQPSWLCKDLQLKLRENGKCIEGGSRVVYPGRNTGLLSMCIEIGLGKPR